MPLVPYLKDFLADQQAEELMSWKTAGDGETNYVKKTEQK